ncbi:hypothetical protein D3C79_938930 [compost metagenome]
MSSVATSIALIRGLEWAISMARTTPRAVSIFGTIKVDPASIAYCASRRVICLSSSIICSQASTLDIMTTCGRAAMTASRSS